MSDLTPAHVADPWRFVSDAVLRGLNHALSNRVTSLSALAMVVAPDQPPDAEIATVLASEVPRLEYVLRLLRLLPAARTLKPEPVLVGDALADALALHAHQAGLGGALCAVEGDPSALPPIVAPPTALVHALVLLLGALALHARAATDACEAFQERPEPTRGVLCLSSDDRHVRLGGVAAGAPDAVPPLDVDTVVDALRGLLAGASATVSGSHEPTGAVRYTVQLPTLLELRSRRG